MVPLGARAKVFTPANDGRRSRVYTTTLPDNGVPCMVPFGDQQVVGSFRAKNDRSVVWNQATEVVRAQ